MALSRVHNRTTTVKRNVLVIYRSKTEGELGKVSMNTRGRSEPS